MYILLLIHGMFTIWILIDGHRRKANIIPWAIGTTILGPVILPLYFAVHPLKAHESRVGGKSQSLFKGLAVFWTLILVAIAIWGVKGPTGIIKEESLGYRLAVISNKGSVREDDAITKRFGFLLDQLSQNYIENSQQIANISVIVHDKVKAYGIDESLLNIMEGMNKLLWPRDSKKGRYSEYAFAYVGLRNKGLTHQDAIESLQAMVSGY